MQNELLPGSRAAALREVLRSLECDAATRTLLDEFVPDVPGVKAFVPVGVAYTEHLLRAIVAAGAGFSIDTAADLQRLSAVEVDVRAVLFRNTEKRPADIRAAALGGVWRFAVASERELQVVASAAPGSGAYVYVAVRASPRPGDMSSASAHEALRLLRMAPELGLRPYGLAFHIGAAADPSTCAAAIDRCSLVMRRLEQLGIRIEMLSIGGAPGGRAADSALVDAIGRLPYRPPLLVAEP
jgi:ornithine decarboxylase